MERSAQLPLRRCMLSTSGGYYWSVASMAHRSELSHSQQLLYVSRLTYPVGTLISAFRLNVGSHFSLPVKTSMVPVATALLINPGARGRVRPWYRQGSCKTITGQKLKSGLLHMYSSLRFPPTKDTVERRLHVVRARVCAQIST